MSNDTDRQHLRDQLSGLLRAFDWTYDYSDDGAAYRRGAEQWRQINQLMILLAAAGDDEWAKAEFIKQRDERGPHYDG